MVRNVFLHGAVELEDPKEGQTFKVNDQHIKQFIEFPQKVDEVTSLHDPRYE